MNKKTVIVTGGSRGIGKAIVTKFATNGHNVVINYNRSNEEANDLYKELINKGCNVRLFKADITNRAEVDLMTSFCVNEFGSIDVLVNNAGMAESKLFTDILDMHWEKMMDVNVKGTFNCSQSALRFMMPEKSGNIINISSIWGMVGASMEVHYSTSKAAIIGFTKALAKELGPSGIRVNCIAPGIVDTDMMSDFTAEEKDDLKMATPLQCLGQPDDIAEVAYFMASGSTGFLTGQVISPNGGFVI